MVRGSYLERKEHPNQTAKSQNVLQNTWKFCRVYCNILSLTELIKILHIKITVENIKFPEIYFKLNVLWRTIR
jgi:hypothetical protein